MKKWMFILFMMSVSSLSFAGNDTPSSLGNQLLFAVYDQNTEYEKIADLIVKGADVKFADENGMTALMMAIARKSDEKIIDSLIFAGSDVNAMNKDGYNALFYAILNKSKIKTVESLINAGANVKAVRKDGYDALLLAVLNNSDHEIIKMLIKAGADVNKQYNNGYTPLMFAIVKRVSPEVIDLLLDNGAKVGIRNREGQDAVTLAVLHAKNGDLIEKLIERGAKVDQRMRNGSTLLMLAVIKNPEVSVIQALLNAKINVNAEDVNGENALMYAVKFNKNTDVAEALIYGSADVNAISKRGETAYSIAIKNKKKEFVDLLKRESASTVIDPVHNRSLPINTRILYLAEKPDATLAEFKELISAGADINAVDAQGRNVFMITAANNKDARIIDELIKMGANDKVINKSDENTLVYVAKNGKNHDAIEHLIMAGMNPNAQINSDKSAFMIAIENTDDADIVRDFIRFGADLRQATILGDTPLIMAARSSKKIEVLESLIKGSDIEASNSKGETALIAAIKRDDDLSVPFAKILIENGTEVNAAGRFGLTPIMIAASYNHNPEMIDLLARFNADVKQKNTAGEDALRLAIRNVQNEKVIDALVKAGADVNDVNNQQESALMLAVMNNMGINVLKILVNAGADTDIVNKNTKETILLMATGKNTDPEVLKTLIAGNPNFDAKDRAGYSPLLKAVTMNPNPEVTEILLNAGAYINEIFADEGATPLIMAIRNNPNPRIVELLIENGANVSVIDKHNKTALDYMEENEKYRHSKAMNLLLSRLVEIREYAVNTEALNKVFALMVRDKNTTLSQFRMMMDHGANVNYTTGGAINSLKSAVSQLGHRMVKALKGKNEKDLGIDAVNDDKLPIFNRMLRDKMEPKVSFLRANPLMLAASYNNNPAVLDYFVKSGVPINQADGYRNTALHYAVAANRPFKIIKTLLSLGANVNARNAGGYTPLMYAAVAGNADTVRGLLDVGADISIRNKDRQSAYDLAVLYNNFTNSALLLKLDPRETEKYKENTSEDIK